MGTHTEPYGFIFHTSWQRVDRVEAQHKTHTAWNQCHRSSAHSMVKDVQTDPKTQPTEKWTSGIQAGGERPSQLSRMVPMPVTLELGNIHSPS